MDPDTTLNVQSQICDASVSLFRYLGPEGMNNQFFFLGPLVDLVLVPLAAHSCCENDGRPIEKNVMRMVGVLRTIFTYCRKCAGFRKGWFFRFMSNPCFPFRVAFASVLRSACLERDYCGDYILEWFEQNGISFNAERKTLGLSKTQARQISDLLQPPIFECCNGSEVKS